MRRKLIIAGIAGLLFCVVIFAGSWTPVYALRTAVMRAFAPVMSAMGRTGRWVAAWHDLAPAEEEDCEACRRHEQARAIAEAELVEARARQASLERALGLKQYLGPSAIPARVTLYARHVQGEMLVIDAGDETGAHVGDHVVDEEGFLVGDIAETGVGFSKVAIASNTGIAFPVSFVPSGAEALARGIGARAFRIELIPQDVSFHAGDFVRRISKDMRSGEVPLVARLADEGDSGGGAFKKAGAILLAHPERLERVMIIPSL
ncbi:MAG: hypothetical protein A3J58_02895 [Candidatus Sungbacteria bacterium RIFCSPHIGHO2_02_FULL_52_23]|uniref:Cell shape-determining protein MreC n=1 Tax=Candidatus Sungbacteria bacterium RIFCSPHIGHO2_02_FULL_52_23 TaxID=1802274 RepID=A0A1G2KVK0_9BACT|nr:MAG: hypothetical protein A3J58_02895 [Candidatus Sungbacteria bacterium RIFCSPHIGHO2_02_FULL_52_23]